MFRSPSTLIAGLAFFALALAAQAQRVPRIGYVYPPGGQVGTSFEVVVGGQYLDAPTGAFISGGGIEVEVLSHDKPPSNQTVTEIRDELRELRPKFREMMAMREASRDKVLTTARWLVREQGITERELRMVEEFERERNDPKRQPNAQIAEEVHLRVTIDAEAEPGLRFWRLRTEQGLSNPIRFAVGQHPEHQEPHADRQFDLLAFLKLQEAPKPPDLEPLSLPVTINGQVMPGEVDRFPFHAEEGEQVVISLQARNLIPYLADAVPGWFQPVVALYDEDGHELAFADDYRFDPDPVLFYKMPKEGTYHVEVRDSIYRGREDFVYRITVGELPFLTGIWPIGAPAGSEVELNLHGGNLADVKTRDYVAPEMSGLAPIEATIGGKRSNTVRFHVDQLPEENEREANDQMGTANRLDVPVIVNGSIGRVGDADFCRVKGRGNQIMIFEIFSRRLGMPVDSSLTAFDRYGDMLGINDDHEDPASGLTTHHADSRLAVKLPPDGDCFILVTDTQTRGGPGYAYRLRITQGAPGYALRVTPSSINARPGKAAKLTVHALRGEGFDGEIALRIKGAEDDSVLRLNNARIPAGEEFADISLSVPDKATVEPFAISIEGIAEVEGKTVITEAVPAEDMMQAFIYRHLVPVDALLLDVRPGLVKDD